MRTVKTVLKKGPILASQHIMELSTKNRLANLSEKLLLQF